MGFYSFCISCTSTSYEKFKDVATQDTLDLQQDIVMRQNVRFSEFIKEINYYPIPSDKDFLIGKVDKLIVTDSIFLIMDRSITHSIFTFSKDRNWKQRLHQHGNGPIDYINLRDVFFNSTNKEIGVYCNLKGRILYYDLKGKYMREQKIPYNAEMVQPVGNNLLLHTEYGVNKELNNGGVYPNLIYMSSNSPHFLQCANYFRGPVNRALVWSSNSWFSSWDDTICIKPDHSNIVYHCTKEKLYPAYFLDMKSQNVDDRYWKKVLDRNTTGSSLEEFCAVQNFCEIIWYLESENFIYFTCKQGNEMIQILYSKTTGKKISINTFENDIDMFASFHPKAICKNKLYGTLNAYSIVKLRTSLSEDLTPEILKGVEPEDNPIIIELTLKSF